MSVTNSRRIALTRPAVDYEMFGPLGSKTYKAHIANGTDRAAAIRCDCEDPFAFVERAEQLRDEHGRKVEAISLIQSFEKSELDPKNPEHVQIINDLGYQLAKRLASDSDALVITHPDSAGGHGHNHIKILNHDNVTGRALRRDFRHFAVAEVNDELMREHSMRVVERGSRDQTKYWEHVRESETIATFDLLLGDRLMTTRLDESWYNQQTWERALSAVGIEIKEERHLIKGTDADGEMIEHESVGWTYRMLDDTSVDEGIKPRVRRRKASSLGDEFTHKSLQAEFEARQAQRAAQQAAAEAAQQAAQPALSAVQQEWLERVSRSYGSAFDARMAMTGARVDVADQNAVMEAWEQAKTADSGVAVADQTEHSETAENGAAEPQIGADEALVEARDPEVTMDGSLGTTHGSSSAASDMAGNAQILENEDPGSWPDGTGSRTASGGQNPPNRDPLMVTPDRQVATEPGEDRGLRRSADELELLQLRYLTVTEGAAWSDEQYDQALARMDALKAQLGLDDTSPPSREDVIAEYESRVLGLAQPMQHRGAEPSSAPASSGPSLSPPGSVDVEQQTDETEPSSPPGSSVAPTSPPGSAGAGRPGTGPTSAPASSGGVPSAPASVPPYRSGVWGLAELSKNEKVKAGLEAIARFDEDARVRLAAGERISHRDVPKGIGQQWLDEYGHRLDPVVRHEMTLRAERMAERRYEFEQVGKPLKDRLGQFGRVPNFSLDEYHDVQAKLAESNRTVKAIEQRMNAGIYEDGSKWRPGQPVPSRQYSKVMTARLHQIADDALAEQAELEDEQLGG